MFGSAVGLETPLFARDFANFELHIDRGTLPRRRHPFDNDHLL